MSGEREKRVVKKPSIEVDIYTEKRVLRMAKLMGLLKYNKIDNRYEIIVSVNDYKKL